MLPNTRIHNPKKMKQPIDFKHLAVDDNIYPTDVDGLIEYKDSEYIIFEIKYRGVEVPCGQKLALERLVGDLTTAGKRVIAIVGEHTVKDETIPVIAAWCKVRELCSSESNGWVTPDRDVSVGEVVHMFHKSA